jgi:hypothetical protein
MSWRRVRKKSPKPISTVVVAEVTKNLTMKHDPACLFINVSTPQGKAGYSSIRSFPVWC